MTHSELERALSKAKVSWASLNGRGQMFGTNEQRLQAMQNVLSAERALAATKGHSYAEVIELGVRWDIGAPLPHLLAGSTDSIVLCRADEPDPEWDGTYAHSWSPSDVAESSFVEITFQGCVSTRIGPPDHDTLPAHPLWGRGLEHYKALIIRNSDWIAERDALHPTDSRDGNTSTVLNHYFLGFHDESIEALARGVAARLVSGTMRTCLNDIVNSLTSKRPR